MLRVKIAELKDRLSEHLRAVEKGAEVEVTDRDRPIARIVPIPDAPNELKVMPPAQPLSRVRNRRRAAAGWPVDSVELLLEERGSR